MSNAHSDGKDAAGSAVSVVAASAEKKLPWGPAAGVIVGLLAFIAAQLVTVLAISAALSGLGWPTWHIKQWSNSVVGQFTFVLAAEALTIGAIWLFLRYRRADWRLLGFGRSLLWRDLGYALLAFAAYYIILTAAANFLGWIFGVNLDQKQDLGFSSVTGLFEKILTFVSLVVLPPLAEETVFRGFLFGGLRSKLPFVGAALITSVLFAVPHLLESDSGVLWIAGVDTFILSMVLCYLREKTGALWAGIAVHMLKNTVAFLALYVFVHQ